MFFGVVPTIHEKNKVTHLLVVTAHGRAGSSHGWASGSSCNVESFLKMSNRKEVETLVPSVLQRRENKHYFVSLGKRDGLVPFGAMCPG